MKNLLKLLLIACLVNSGCSWIRLATKPVYDIEEKIPMTVGINFDNSQGSNTYGPMVVRYLMDFKIFNSIVYPYKEGDKVDGVLDLNIQGRWVKKSIGNLVVLYPILSPFLGPSMVAKHNTVVGLNCSLIKIASYDFLTETKIKHGVLADKGLVVQRGDSIQSYKIAYQIAGKMLMDQEKIQVALKKK